MKLLSIFIGRPREIEYQGRVITTGIFKEETSGPAKVGALNIEGDQQADLKVHGGPNKAVYAYPIEHYDFWKANRPDLTFHAGIFGENLSVSGFKETTVCIGDTYRFGEAVTFQVTSPRMPCSKLGMKMNDNHFIKEFMEARKNGFYFKVLTEGEISPGDEAVKVSEDGHGLTVDEVIQLYTTHKQDSGLLEKALAAPHLPEDWKEHFQKALAKLK